MSVVGISIAIYLSYISSVLSVINENICFWGREGMNAVLNGEYVYSGIYNDMSYYSMTVDSSCKIGSYNTFYIFHYDTHLWLVSDTLGDMSNLYAYCSSSDAPNGPTTACDGNWKIMDSIDLNVTVTYGSCPELDCSSITTSFPNSNVCQTDFIEHIGHNQWKGYNSIFGIDVYFYFAPQFFMWICDNIIDNTCEISAYDTSESGWNDLNGSSISMDFIFSSSTGTISCTTDSPTIFVPTVATSNPTNIPTVAPITNNPSTFVTSSYGSCVNGGVEIQILHLKDASDGYFSSPLKDKGGVENVNNYEANAYSIIGDVDPNDYISDNSYEFHLVYGDTKINGEGDPIDTMELHWTQNVWITQEWTTQAAPGFNLISANPPQASGLESHQYFYGLGLSSHPDVCYLDGTSKASGDIGYFNCIGPHVASYGGAGYFPSYNLGASQSQYLYGCRITPIECGINKVWDDSVKSCVRDCNAFAFDSWLNQCSITYPADQISINDKIEQAKSSASSDLVEAIATLETARDAQIDELQDEIDQLRIDVFAQINSFGAKSQFNGLIDNNNNNNLFYAVILAVTILNIFIFIISIGICCSNKNKEYQSIKQYTTTDNENELIN